MKTKYDYYDYLIIGGGPAGLTLAYCLGSIGKRCIIIDKNNSLGGCHRVTRVNGLFTEHGPRIYSSSYITTRLLLEDMGYDFFDLFKVYNFSISTISGKSLEYFNVREIGMLALEFFKLLIGIEDSRNTSVLLFATRNNFSQRAKDYLDRICRLTDGAGSDRYTLFEFLSLINQQAFYKLYQPRLPNDIGLFRVWEEAILNTGNVEILKETEVVEIVEKKGKIEYITIKKGDEIKRIKGKNSLFCIPPKPFLKILENSSTNILSSYPNFKGFTQRNSYINDIPVVFHWDKKLNLPRIWGFPSTEWGIAFIVLSNYMEFQDPRSQTVISTCITNINRKSSHTNKTANETNDKDELIREVFRQLKIAFPDLPQASYSILHPSVYRDISKGEWIESDTAYVETYFQEFIPPQNPVYKNMYYIGTQNGNSLYNFTSMESAISNAIHTFGLLEPEFKHKFKVKGGLTIIQILRVILISIFLIILIWMLVKLFSKRNFIKYKNYRY